MMLSWILSSFCAIYNVVYEGAKIQQYDSQVLK